MLMRITARLPAKARTKRNKQGGEFILGRVSARNFRQLDAKFCRAVSCNLAVGPGIFFKHGFKFRISFLVRQPIKNDCALKVVNNSVHA